LLQNADPQEEQNEDNYSGKNELDNQALENLLKGLLDQANNEEEGHQMHKGDQPTNSGTLASEENIDGEVGLFYSNPYSVPLSYHVIPDHFS
jgi:hypothetical protein